MAVYDRKNAYSSLPQIEEKLSRFVSDLKRKIVTKKVEANSISAVSISQRGHKVMGGYANASSPDSQTLTSGTSYQNINCYFDLTPGTYILSGSVSFNGNNTNRRSVQWERTTAGYESEYLHSRTTVHAGSTAAVRLNAVAIVVVPDDVASLRFGLRAWQNSGDTLGVSAAARYIRIA